MVITAQMYRTPTEINNAGRCIDLRRLRRGPELNKASALHYYYFY